MNLLLLALALLAAPDPAEAADACGCSATFDEVVAATETSYAGYVVKLPDDDAREEYRRFRELLRSDARGASPERCEELLDDYTGFFADHHLFVLDRSGRTPRLPALRQRWTERRVRDDLGRRGDLRDPLEGLWFEAGGKVAVVHDPALPPGDLVAVRLEGDEAGEVLARFSRRGTGYRADYRMEGEWGWQSGEASLRRGGDLLVFGLEAYGREGAPRLDPDDPRAPHFARLEDGTYYLSLPSFLPQYREAVVELTEAHRTELSEARGLVVDVRGNGGGDAIYFPLADFFLDRDIEISRDTKILASPWTLEYFEKLRERQGEAGSWLDAALERMRAHPGEIVPYLEARTDGLESYPKKPERVVVLQDRGVGSAAEAFIFHAGQSGKVTTMGEPTRGNIDYMQVSMHRLGCGDFAVWFGYPLYFAADLPEGSIDDEGYPPDVRLGPDVDWVGFAVRWLAAE